jgi:tRNA modification GTPase
MVDMGLALYFPQPRSFTGEDVLELHAHGGPVPLDLLVRRVIQLGGRQARPGEFSERAFLNGKLDLVQAEAVADLIQSSSELAARSALRSLSGEFSARVQVVVEALLRLRTQVEGTLDFPEDDLGPSSEPAVTEDLAAIQGELAVLMSAARQGSLLREGMTVVVVGRPNAGKSTLLNALAQREVAIVTEVPGTTRDVVRETIQIDGMPLHVVDTAGLRDTSDPVEQEGVRRAWQAAAEADHVLLVVDDMLGVGAQDKSIRKRLPDGVAVTVVRNKIDRTGRLPGRSQGDLGEEVALSASTGLGLTLLRSHLKECIRYRGAGEGSFSARRRHLEALDRGERALSAARRLEGTGRSRDLVAEELRLAQQALGEITGEVVPEDLLGRIFSTFCIGK